MNEIMCLKIYKTTLMFEQNDSNNNNTISVYCNTRLIVKYEIRSCKISFCLFGKKI